MTRPSPSEDRGDTLIEVLIAIVIMGIAAAGIFGGLLTSVNLSSYHRSQSSAGVAVRDYGEAIVNYVGGTGYASCAAASAYGPATVGYVAPSGYTASIVTVQYWTGSAWSGSCGTDLGLQQLSLKVVPTNSRAAETLTVVVRKPCASGSSCS
jgi:prepilin-type N-terminal cleavage/methylation domain-containing protein